MKRARTGKGNLHVRAARWMNYFGGVRCEVWHVLRPAPCNESCFVFSTLARQLMIELE